MISDDAAVQAMELVLAKSGGLAAWKEIRSSKETFKISMEGQAVETRRHFLDDWSTDATRYRRGSPGMQMPPSEHNGSSTFVAEVGKSKLTVPEFDQAMAIVQRLPAAAAEIMLRKSNYILKTATTRPCHAKELCVDVFEKNRPDLMLAPEQQWTISSDTGLPAQIAVRAFAVGPPQMRRWRIAQFVEYGTKDDVLIPVSIEIVGPTPGKQIWSLASYKKNVGFDIAQFDQEVR